MSSSVKPPTPAPNQEIRDHRTCLSQEGKVRNYVHRPVVPTVNLLGGARELKKVCGSSSGDRSFWKELRLDLDLGISGGIKVRE